VTQNGCCLYCKCSFLRSPYRPQQAVCRRPECQRRRRADYHRQKLEADPEYRQIAHDSQKKWREAHPDYLPRCRAQHPEAVERNRERRQRRDQKRRIRWLEKNNPMACAANSPYTRTPIHAERRANQRNSSPALGRALAGA